MMSVDRRMLAPMSARRRTILVWVLLVLGTIVVLVGSLTVWVKRQRSTRTLGNTSSQLLEDDDVRSALSIYMSTSSTRISIRRNARGSAPGEPPGARGPARGLFASPRSRAWTNFLSVRASRSSGRTRPRGDEALLRILGRHARGRSTRGRCGHARPAHADRPHRRELGFGEQLDSHGCRKVPVRSRSSIPISSRPPRPA